jgi:glycosyltransferase involved in cell wall biosynthesis
MKIAFIFIVKDGEEYLQRNINSIKKFNQDIYAVENNSVDNTKQILSQSDLTKVIFLDLDDDKHSTELCSADEEFNCNKRTRRLAYLRQCGLDAVMNSGIEYDYVCMLDLDFYSFNYKQLLGMFTHMEKDREIDGMFGMSHSPLGVPYDTGAIEPKSKTKEIRLKTQRYVDVESAFSGFGIYRYSSIEHIDFNRQLNKLIVDTHFNPIYGTHTVLKMLQGYLLQKTSICICFVVIALLVIYLGWRAKH